MMEQPHEIADLAQTLLKAAGKQNPVTLMKALLLCMQLVDATTHEPRKYGDPGAHNAGRTVPNAQGNKPPTTGD